MNMETENFIYDVAIIGGGVVGCLIARELSKYNISIMLLEKEADISSGTSKGNSAIVHAGFDAEEGSLKAKLNVMGCQMMPEIARELSVPFVKNGSLVCAFSEYEREHLKVLRARGKLNGVEKLNIIGKERLAKLEPNLSPDVVAALYAPDAGIVGPYELAVAAAENACANGAKIRLEFEVSEIKKIEDVIYVYSADGECVKTKFLINSAGLYSDVIADMCGDGNNYRIIPRRGEYMLMDRKLGKSVSHTLFSVPSDKGKGILVSPTVDGNLILGPNANEVERDDTDTTSEGLSEVQEGAMRLVPSINPRLVITSFAGVRSTPANHDFNIEMSKNMKNVLHLVGIESPGLASSPAIALYVVYLMCKSGFSPLPKENFNPVRVKNKPFREMSAMERVEAVKENKLYSKVICRCETVTEAEIVNAAHSLCPASNLDAVKRRTRAGMGRCQGGFCSPRVVEILARELEIPMTEVTKKGRSSYILSGKTKE